MNQPGKAHGLGATVWAWLLLVAMTAIAWRFGMSARGTADGLSLAVIGVIASAGIKVWIVGYQFMELRIAPRGLRYGFLAWVVVIGLVLIAICLQPATRWTALQ